MNRRNKNTGERGLFYLLFLGLVLVLIMIIALGLEIGRLLVADRQLQNAADAASLAAVQLLYRCDEDPNNYEYDPSPTSVPLNGDNSVTADLGNCPGGSRGGWQASKAAVIGVLAKYKILGRQITDPVYRSDLGIGTCCDEKAEEGNVLQDGYGTTLQSTEGVASVGADSSDLRFKVIRMFECEKDDGEKDILPIDGGEQYPPANPVVNLSDCGAGYPYCVANAVSVELEKDITMPLARVFGIVDPKRTIKVAAVSVLRLYDPDDASKSCTVPKCNLLRCNVCPDGSDPLLGKWPDCPDCPPNN